MGIDYDLAKDLPQIGAAFLLCGAMTVLCLTIGELAIYLKFKEFDGDVYKEPITIWAYVFCVVGLILINLC